MLDCIDNAGAVRTACDGRAPRTLSAQTPKSTVRGQVVEHGTLRSIAGADVALSGLPAVLTDDSGTFQITGVRAARTRPDRTGTVD